MESEEMNAVSLIKLKDHPVTVPLIWLAVIFVAGWTGKPMVRAAFAEEFYTQTQAEEHVLKVADRLSKIEVAQGLMSTTMNTHIADMKAGTAFQLVRGLESDLASHQRNRRTDDAWLDREQHLISQVELSHEYKDCVMGKRDRCEIILQQIRQ